MPYFDCKIVVIQGKIGFIKVILIEKIDDFSPPQARNFEKKNEGYKGHFAFENHLF